MKHTNAQCVDLYVKAGGTYCKSGSWNRLDWLYCEANKTEEKKDIKEYSYAELNTEGVSIFHRNFGRFQQFYHEDGCIQKFIPNYKISEPERLQHEF
jgi:hypothetical protein